jgi:hypothetical protein
MSQNAKKKALSVAAFVVMLTCPCRSAPLDVEVVCWQGSGKVRKGALQGKIARWGTLH